MKHYSDFASMEGVKRAVDSFKRSVTPIDVLVGAFASLTVGRALGGYIAKKVLASGTPEAGSLKAKLVEYAPELGGIATGAVLFVAQKGTGRAPGHLVGAVGGAVLPRAADWTSAKLAEAKVPGFSELMPVNYGLLQMGELQRMADFQDFANADFNGLEEEAGL